MAPVVPIRPNQGYQYRGFGADVALELCRNSLKLLPKQAQDYVCKCIRPSRKEALLTLTVFARREGLIREEE